MAYFLFELWYYNLSNIVIIILFNAFSVMLFEKKNNPRKKITKAKKQKKKEKEGFMNQNRDCNTIT